MKNDSFYLPAGLPAPVPEADGLAAPFWSGLQQERLLIQRCAACACWQFGPEWICHRCHSFELNWEEVPAQGRIYSWERVWHPVHPVLTGRCPYLAVLVELPQAGYVRMVGNLLGDPLHDVSIGAQVVGVYEHRHPLPSAYTLLQWRLL
jgi:uncharacterized protein